MRRTRAWVGTDPGRDDLRTLFGREHDQMAELLEDVRAAVFSGDVSWAAACGAELERRLAAHGRMENEQILPLLDRIDPDEALALRGEHAAVRAGLARVVRALDATSALDEIDRLARALEAHAAREDARAYPVADAALPELTRASLLARVRERLASFVHRARRPLYRAG